MHNRSRFDPHSHTHYSNLRLLDCINKPKDLVDRAINLGLKGIAITDHECISSHMELNIYSQELQEQYPDFKIALGNEIYLTKDRETGQKYYHFILIAKNKIGHRALRELSSRAWMNSFMDRGMERVVTTYDDLEEIVNKYPNSLIATSACLGGELSTQTLNLILSEKHQDKENEIIAHNNIIEFILFCKKLFNQDFYIECAPGCSKEQIMVNQRLVSIAQCFNIKMVIGTDAHYLKKEDRFVHKSYLNSKGGEREVDDFYEYSYLQSEEEIFEHLKKSNFDNLFIEQMFDNSMEIWEKIENYSLLHKQTIPHVKVKNYPKLEEVSDFCGKNNPEWNFPTLNNMLCGDNKIERYWVNECLNKLKELGKYNTQYLSRLEEEADIKKTIGEKLETNMFAYPVTLQHYCDLFWECGSVVGAGRGSSCSGLNHYLLGITQLDPIEWDLPFWRYLNKERTELGDIDIDLCPSKRPLILRRIKDERGKNFKDEIDELSRKNLGCTLIATFGTEGTRSTILTACRGYRSEDCPDGIDNDTAQFLSSLIPSERGFLWSLSDVINGNPEKGRKPNQTFIREVNKYPGLLDIMQAIGGLINKRSSHASGVILFDEDPYEFGCFMKTPKGEIITQYDLHMCEAAGMTKYDFLVTEVQDKITECIHLLQEYGEIDSTLTLKEVYDNFLHPEVLPLENPKIWEALKENSVLNIFQFDSDVGSQAAKKIEPHSILEMSDANGLMRLMTAEKGAETPMDKYVRYKKNINLWYQEMDRYGLTKAEQKILEPYFKSSYGVPPSQEQLMRMLMDKKICNFSLAEANAARKIVGKKQMAKIPSLKEKVLKQATSERLGQYVWENGVGPQMGYSFSIIHALAYSFIGVQTIFLATNWNPIFWNAACLIINSASLETEDDDEDDNKKDKTTDYAKLAKAIGDIRSRGIKISLVDINKSTFSFRPDIENNEILFGLKGVNKVGDAVIDQIIKNRPYNGIIDFMNKCPLNKTVMISLIKAGAFDKIDYSWASKICKEPRKAIMAYYLLKTGDLKKKLTLQNFNGLMKKGLIPETLLTEQKIFIFNKFLKSYCKKNEYFILNNKNYEFCSTFLNEDEFNIFNINNGIIYILQSQWEKIYKKHMDNARQWLKDNQQSILTEFNTLIFKELWEKYATGTISAWEMESLCFYYHKHELADVDTLKYGIVNFEELSATPKVDYFFKRGGKEIPIYKTYKIMGTVLSKNDSRSSVTLLTLTGVINVKFTKEYFAMFNRQISETQPDGTKKIVEKGWFTRGTKLLVTGFRRDDMFQAKTYSHTPTHQLYLIEKVEKDNSLILRHDRAI